MIKPSEFFNSLNDRGIGFFVGVPDSLLKNFCAYVDDYGSGKHIITANEGNAVGLAMGYHLATNKVAAVYMQNSGLGNTINPLTSLTDPEVYCIPMLLIIGWRGEPNLTDEPQHVKQGQITSAQLKLLGIPYWVLDANSDIDVVLTDVFAKLHQDNSPVALLVRKNTFSSYKSEASSPKLSKLKREDVLRSLLKLAKPNDLVVSTTGKTSREVFELRLERHESQRDFLTVGGMGHTSSIALGVALGNPSKRILCFDGDGSVLMHLGALPIIGSLKPKNFIHVLLNNAAHESVGGQPTVGNKVDFAAIALASGYCDYRLATDKDSLKLFWQELSEQDGPVLLEVLINKESRDDLGRPTTTPQQNKLAFMETARA